MNGGARHHHKHAIVSDGGWLSSPTAEAGGEAGRQEFAAQDGESDGSMDSGGAYGSSGKTARRWASSGREPSGLRSRRQEEEGDDHSVDRDDDDFRADNEHDFEPVEGNGGGGTAATAVSRGGAASGGHSLPEGWMSFTSPEGWEYFFHNETRVVQWKRPTH